MSVFPILEVPDAARDEIEQLGSKPKFWYVDDKGTSRLFKEGRNGTGENWAEKVAAELCGLLDIPRASYDFARWRGIEGISTANIAPAPDRLVLANEVLTKVVRGYGREPQFKRKSHTISLLGSVLEDPSLATPAGHALPPGIANCGDVFVGYLLLDAWIGNTDRHDQNWGFIVRLNDRRTTVSLAPTFDHASSLGCHLRDADQAKRLATKDSRFSVGFYGLKANSALYRSAASSKPLNCIEAFEVFAASRRSARAVWLEKLNSVDRNAVYRILDRVPSLLMGGVAKEFVAAFLDATKNALLENPENRR